LKTKLEKVAGPIAALEGDRRWLVVWAIDDAIQDIRETLDTANHRPGVAELIYLHHEAVCLGIDGRPNVHEVKDALMDAIVRASSPPPGTDWQGRQQLVDAVMEWACRVRILICREIVARLRIPTQPLMGPHPACGRWPRGSCRKQLGLPEWEHSGGQADAEPGH